MHHALTAREGIALDIIFGLLGESRFNREIDDWGTTYKYLYVASRAPKQATMFADVNKVLREMANAGYVPFEICSCKLGDHYYRYDKFPTSLSKETIRKAWIKSGMRELQLQHKRLKAKPARSH